MVTNTPQYPQIPTNTLQNMPAIPRQYPEKDVFGSKAVVQVAVALSSTKRLCVKASRCFWKFSLDKMYCFKVGVLDNRPPGCRPVVVRPAAACAAAARPRSPGCCPPAACRPPAARLARPPSRPPAAPARLPPGPLPPGLCPDAAMPPASLPPCRCPLTLTANPAHAPFPA